MGNELHRKIQETKSQVAAEQARQRRAAVKGGVRAGLETGNKPSHQAGLGIVGALVGLALSWWSNK